MNIWNRLTGRKEVPKELPKPRYKVTFNFIDSTTGRAKNVTVPNATRFECYWCEADGVFSHRIWIERNIQIWIESDRQTLVSVTSEVVNG